MQLKLFLIVILSFLTPTLTTAAPKKFKRCTQWIIDRDGLGLHRVGEAAEKTIIRKYGIDEKTAQEIRQYLQSRVWINILSEWVNRQENHFLFHYEGIVPVDSQREVSFKFQLRIIGDDENILKIKRTSRLEIEITEV